LVHISYDPRALHGKATAYVREHPTSAAYAIAVLTILVIVLFIVTIVYHHKWMKARTGGFTGPNGSWTGGMHANWQNGSVHDQNYFGPGLQHYAQLGHSYMPAVTSKNALQSQLKGTHHMHAARLKASAHRAAVRRMHARRAGGHRDGLAPNPAAGGNPLDPNTGYEGDDDGAWTFDQGVCPSTGSYDPVTGTMLVTDQTIGQVWNPDAIAEAQALASTGSYVTDPQGDEMALQAAIDSSYGSNAAANTMTDAQLSSIMAGGTAP
jgi:hypothetical protein